MDRPSRKQNRLEHYDYSTPNAYFLTICTENRKSLFWKDVGAISNVVRQMKGAASKRAGFGIWQKGFYDHIIRSEADDREIWEYIEGNPARWTSKRQSAAGEGEHV